MGGRDGEIAKSDRYRQSCLIWRGVEFGLFLVSARSRESGTVAGYSSCATLPIELRGCSAAILSICDRSSRPRRVRPRLGAATEAAMKNSTTTPAGRLVDMYRPNSGQCG